MQPNSQETADLFTFTEEILKGTVIQIEKALINDRLRVSKVSENFAFQQLYIILQ